LLDQKCLLVIDAHDEKHETAATLKKYFKTIAKHFTGHIIYVVEDITSYNRKRLIDQRIAFIVPGKQLYLPFYATDLRESFKKLKERKDNKLGAVAQQLLFLQLYKKLDQGIPAQVLAEQLGVSKMSVSRAYAELDECQLAKNELIGRQKVLLFSLQGRELWEAAAPSLINPVRKRVWVDRASFPDQSNLRIEAGETALSRFGMLMPPKHSVYAVNYNEWAGLKKLKQIEELPRAYEDAITIELWRYDPENLATEGRADPLSLYMSLSDENDDRVDIARDELLEIALERVL
jgi:DNA-binding MarR family transcriptional regulator